MALEQIAKAEQELQDFMVYSWQSWTLGRLYYLSG
jgi:hypothetical protein